MQRTTTDVGTIYVDQNSSNIQSMNCEATYNLSRKSCVVFDTTCSLMAYYEEYLELQSISPFPLIPYSSPPFLPLP